MPSENQNRRRLVLLAFGFLGLLGMALCTIIVFYVYEFASMVNPALHGTAYLREVLAKMFLSDSVVATALGLTLYIGGASLTIWSAAVAAGLIAYAPTRRAWLAILAGIVAVLVMGGVIVAFG